jgi:hypothetical protein
MGERCCRGIVVCPIVPREGVILTRIAEDCRVRFVGKGCFDLSLRRFRDELIFLGQMHQQRSNKPVDFSQIFVSLTAMISDPSVDALAHGR